jgi:exodeoxyribonuclease VII large subunit
LRIKLKSESLVLPDKIYTVSQVTQLVKIELENAFPLLWVDGEISNFHRHSSGHLYFSLKDASSQLRCVMFRSEARQVPFEMKDGLQVICRGRVNVYEPRGEYQLVADLVQPKGIGALQLAFEQLKEKLKNEGLFDPQRKKKLPLFPKKIGIVTSLRGAAIVDILKTLERRFARLHILIYPVKVQGEGAAEEIVEGIDSLGNYPGLDVLIVGRGGGSMEDLWAFNEEKVARAIFRCPIPVISAVGHEVDFTISDFVADIRASTPTAAAEMVVEKEQAFEDRISGFEERIVHHLRYSLQENKHRVFSLTHDQAFQNFKVRLLGLEQEVDDLEIRAWNCVRKEQQKISEMKSRAALLSEIMRNLLRRRLQEHLADWDKLSAGLQAHSPFNILQKGYTLCWQDHGRGLIRTIDEVQKDKEVTVSFYRGEFTCRVNEIDPLKPIQSRVLKEQK